MTLKPRSLNLTRPRWQWYLSGALVIVGALMLFAYIVFIQASAAFVEGSMSLETFQLSLGERMIKVLLLVLTMGLFLFFFSVQDYRVTFSNLLERLSFISQFGTGTQGFTKEGTEGAGTLTVAGADYSDLALIESSVESMLSQNRDYRNRLDAQRDEQRDYFLLQMMKGWMEDTTVARRICRSFDLELMDSEFLVFVTGAAHMDEGSRVQEEIASMAYLRAKRLLEQMLTQLFSVSALKVDGKLVCLITPVEGEEFDTPNFAELTSAIKLTHQLVYDETRITFQTALGSIENGLPGVHRSYAEAEENYEYALLVGIGSKVAMSRNTVAHDEDEQLTRLWFELERRLFNCIETEMYLEAETLFNEALECGYISKAPSFALAKSRMLDLTNILLNTLEQTSALVNWDTAKMQSTRTKVLSCTSLAELKNAAADIFDTLNYQSSAKRRQSSYLRIMEVIDYIEANYRDANLSVNQIASNFGMNPSYLSRNFKNLMAMGLSDYIRRFRIQKAKELMRDNAVSVKQAAELVGFTNALTMNRAFRKQEGTTAGRLRKTQQEPE